ncbi:cupin domain-containing protein [Albirhodobacter sp. R86504]|uniref:cupin domain-containing protein n=1 Tax=Albirhodobacter sp. R86504 TaxID=3093848 RepID=UPI00366E2742
MTDKNTAADATSPHPYILRGQDIAATQGTDKTHFLNPAAKRRNISLGDATGLTGLGLHLMEIQPGFVSTEHHKHHHEDEAVYILEGQATARIGDESFSVRAGDFIGYPKGGLAHSLKNTGDGPLKCLVIGERLAHDVGDYPDKSKRIYRNAGLPWSIVPLEHIEHLGDEIGKK